MPGNHLHRRFPDFPGKIFCLSSLPGLHKKLRLRQTRGDSLYSGCTQDDRTVKRRAVDGRVLWKPGKKERLGFLFPF